MNTNYSMYSKYYDRLNDNYSFWLPFIDDQLVHFPLGSRIIEYGCGTGNILKHYEEKFTITGVDISSKMLDQAKSKIPKGKFYLADMVTFEPKEKYDIALCLFDTVNHILDFNLWDLFFANVEEALVPNGIFILDANTTERLIGIEKKSPFFQEFDCNYLYMKIKRNGEKNFIFDVRILKKIQDSNYVEEKEEIEETTVSGSNILISLEKHFQYVTPYNENKDEISIDQLSKNESYRWFFICKKKFA